MLGISQSLTYNISINGGILNGYHPEEDNKVLVISHRDDGTFPDTRDIFLRNLHVRSSHIIEYREGTNINYKDFVLPNTTYGVYGELTYTTDQKHQIPEEEEPIPSEVAVEPREEVEVFPGQILHIEGSQIEFVLPEDLPENTFIEVNLVEDAELPETLVYAGDIVDVSLTFLENSEDYDGDFQRPKKVTNLLCLRPKGGRASLLEFQYSLLLSDLECICKS